MLEFRSDSYVASYWWVHKASFLKVSVPLGPGTVVAVAIFGPTLDHPKSRRYTWKYKATAAFGEAAPRPSLSAIRPFPLVRRLCATKRGGRVVSLCWAPSASVKRRIWNFRYSCGLWKRECRKSADRIESSRLRTKRDCPLGRW